MKMCIDCYFYTDGNENGWCDYWQKQVKATDSCDKYEAIEFEEGNEKRWWIYSFWGDLAW